MDHHTLNTITDGFGGGGKTSSTKNKYAPTVIHVFEDIANVQEQDLNPVSFFEKDVVSIMANENDPMILKV